MHKISYSCDATPFRGESQRFHYLYRIDNLVSGKFYIGIHSTGDLDDGYSGSGTNIKSAIAKYGIDNFHKTILSFHQTRKQLMDAEKSVVDQQLLEDANCYNIAIGGERGRDKYGRCKKMIELETGKIFNSLSDLKKQVTMCCDPKRLAVYTSKQGYHYALYEPKYDDPEVRQVKIDSIIKQRADNWANRSVKIRDAHSRLYLCIETGEVWKGLHSIKASLNTTSGGTILFGSVRKIKGFHFIMLQEHQQPTQQLIDDINAQLQQYYNRPRHYYQAKRVQCVETGEIFESCRAASRHIKRSLHSVEQALRSSGIAGGLHWKLV